MSRVCVAIPTYNERNNLPILVQQLNDIFQQHSVDGWIVIVDDNSPDGTGAIADELAHSYRHISVIHRAGKAGLGSAYKEAFALALSRPDTSVVVEMDADLSHDPSVLPELLAPIADGQDVVVASRKVTGGGTPDWPLHRRLISSAANLLSRILLGIKVRDATSGYRAFSRNALEKTDFRSAGDEGFAFQIEMLSQSKKAGLNVSEVPFVFRERKYGKSKLRRSEIWGFLKTVLRLTFA